MVELYNAGPLGIEEMRRIMSLQLFDTSQLDDNLLAERVPTISTVNGHCLRARKGRWW